MKTGKPRGRPPKPKPVYKEFVYQKKKIFKCRKCQSYNTMTEDNGYAQVPLFCYHCGNDKFDGINV